MRAFIRTGVVLLVAYSTAVTAGEVTLSNTTANNFVAKAFPWENVNQNDPATNPPLLQAAWETDVNYNCGDAWINSTMMLDSSSLRVAGITWHFTVGASSTMRNYYPAIKQGTKYYRRPGNHNADFNGYGPFTFDCGNDWIEVFDGTKGGAIGDMVVADGVPDFGNGAAPITFGFLQWGGSTGGQGDTTVITDLAGADVRYVIETRVSPGLVANFDASEGSGATGEHPSKQMWRQLNTAGDTVVGVDDAGTPAWRLRDTTSDNPRYQIQLSATDFAQMYANGWEFEIRGKAIQTGGFCGWGLTTGNDPGWGLAGRERVGFALNVVNGGADFQCVPTHGSTIVLAGEGALYHTILCVGQPSSSEYEFFLDGISRGTFDIKDGGSNSGSDNLVAFMSGSSGGVNREVYWNKVRLEYVRPTGTVFYLR
jgi:hypothetical protein